MTRMPVKINLSDSLVESTARTLVDFFLWPGAWDGTATIPAISEAMRNTWRTHARALLHRIGPQIVEENRVRVSRRASPRDGVPQRKENANG